MKTDEKKSIQKVLKKNKKELVNYPLILRITLLAFLISILFSFLSETIMLSPCGINSTSISFTPMIGSQS